MNLKSGPNEIPDHWCENEPTKDDTTSGEHNFESHFILTAGKATSSLLFLSSSSVIVKVDTLVIRNAPVPAVPIFFIIT